MKKKVFAAIELVISLILIAAGLISMIKMEFFAGYMNWVLLGFFLLKILLVLFRQLTYKVSKTYTIGQIVLNIAVLILMIVYRDQTVALNYVVLFSCLIDLLTNIFKAVAYRKKRDNESFFGMDNIICILFIVLFLMANRTIESDLELTAGVLFGTFVMYKGATNLLSNLFVRKLITLSDLGRTFNKVHALDVFFGLIIVLMLTSFILPWVEPNINTIGDAWWYCFALITTIGFGDYTCVTLIGRTLSVLIGFYGIIIVSLLTSSMIIYISAEAEREEKERHEREARAKAKKEEKMKAIEKKEEIEEESEEKNEEKAVVEVKNDNQEKKPKKKKKETKKETAIPSADPTDNKVIENEITSLENPIKEIAPEKKKRTYKKKAVEKDSN